MRLIDADKLIEVFAEKKEVWRGNGVLPSNESLMWLAAMDITSNAPTVDAVPLDKLCERLAERYEPPYTLIDIDKLKAPIDFRQQKEIWLAALTKWMEEQQDD